MRNGFTCKWVSDTDRKRPGLRAGYVSLLEKRLNSVEEEIGRLRKDKRAADGNEAESPTFTDFQSPVQNHVHTPMSVDRHHQCGDYLDNREGMTQLCQMWFERYHPWFPILHQITLMEELNKPCLYCSPHMLVFRAIAAVTSTELRKRSDSVRDSIFLAVSKTLSLRSLQALLILTILDYGDGKIPQFYNLIAVCKRMSTQLGLRDLVAIGGGNFNKSSGTIPPRMLRLPENLVQQEECVRAYWITDALDSASTIGTAWNLLLNPSGEFELLPCRDDIWTTPENIDIENMQDVQTFSATFTLYVGLVCDVCHDVHTFLQTPFKDQDSWRQRAQAVDTKLIAWRESHWRNNFLASPGGNRKTAFVAISLVISCSFHLARLSLYQRPALTNPFNGGDSDIWLHAIESCFDSCNNLAIDLEMAGSFELEHVHPQVSFCTFVAARFLLRKFLDRCYSHPANQFKQYARETFE